MLVLTRKKDQALIIADNIVVTILDIQGDQIRLGVEAPKSVKIFRKELYLEILEENKAAARLAAQVPEEDLKSLLDLPETGGAITSSSIQES